MMFENSITNLYFIPVVKGTDTNRFWRKLNYKILGTEAADCFSINLKLVIGIARIFKSAWTEHISTSLEKSV